MGPSSPSVPARLTPAPSVPRALVAPPRLDEGDALSATLARAVSARAHVATSQGPNYKGAAAALAEGMPTASIDAGRVTGPLLQRQDYVGAAGALAAASFNDKITASNYKKWLSAKVTKDNVTQTNAKLYGLTPADHKHVVTALTQLKQAAAANDRANQMAARVANSLREAQEEPAGGVTVTHRGVIAYLDYDQLPHQPQGERIGGRQASKNVGSRFVRQSGSTLASPEWHREHTLVQMCDWAADNQPQLVNDGDVVATHQAVERSGIYYEGYAGRTGGQTYVFFHCYPGPNWKKFKDVYGD